MKKLAFKMFLNEGCEAEYEKRHNEIWPELQTLLKQAGVADYSIFLDEETMVLFGVLECHDDEKYRNLPLDPIMKKWWNYMKDIMKTNEDASPVSISLKQVFHLD